MHLFKSLLLLCTAAIIVSSQNTSNHEDYNDFDYEDDEYIPYLIALVERDPSLEKTTEYRNSTMNSSTEKRATQMDDDLETAEITVFRPLFAYRAKQLRYGRRGRGRGYNPYYRRRYGRDVNEN